MGRVPHHDPEHGGSIFLTTLSLPFENLRVRQAHPTSKYPEEDRGAVSLSNESNRFMAQTALEPHLMLVPYDLVSTEEE